MLGWLKQRLCSHSDVIDTANYYTDRPAEFRSYCRECGKTFPPPDKWVEAERRGTLDMRRLRATEGILDFE